MESSSSVLACDVAWSRELERVGSKGVVVGSGIGAGGVEAMLVAAMAEVVDSDSVKRGSDS